jgi:hypothetical protein
MTRGGLSRLFLLVGIVLAVGVFGAAVARADLRHAPGPAAGLLADGSIYLTATDDNYWHQVDPATFATLGYSYNDIKWYGGGGLPGSIAPQTTPTPLYPAFAAFVPPVNLMGLLGTGGVYVAPGDGFFYPVTATDFVKHSYSWSWVKWFGSLPGTIALGF